MQHRQIPQGTIEKAGEAISVGEREAIFIASTDSPDRHGDIVQQNWEFRDFLKNPVLLFQHQSSSLPIGKVSRLWTDKGKTYAKVEATPEGMDGTADKVWRFIKGGFLNAVSVGFLPIDPPQERYSKASGDFLGFTFPKNSLLELSVVSVPANQEALAVARSFDMNDDDVCEIFAPGVQASKVQSAKRFVEIQRLRVSN